MRRKKIPLAWQTVLAAIMAIIIGKVWPWAAAYAGGFTPIFVRALSFLLIPYIFIGICGAITKKSEREFTGRIILKNLSSFVTMEMLAIFTALLVSNIVFMNSAIELPNTPTPAINNPREFGDFITNIVPQDLMSAFSPLNLLAVVVTACLFGYFTNRCADRSRIFLTNLYNSCGDVLQRICDLVSSLCPIGIFCVFSQLATDGAIFNSLYTIRPLITAACVGLAIHALVSIPIILRLTAKCNPYRLIKTFSNSLFNSLGFSTPTLTIPMAINRMKSEAGISAHIADFSMPVISTLNFNGTSIFLATATMYVAQAYGINLSIMEQVILMFAVSFITIGTVGSPLKLSLIMYPIMESMGIPLEGMGALMLCEMLFGMICPVVDVWSNIAITVNIAEGEGDKIKTEAEAGIN